jgi:hypothetical protein
MTTHSIIRNGVRVLFAALLAAAICAVWPLAAQAKGQGTHVDHAPITIQKTNDKASASLAKTKGTKTTKPAQYMTITIHDAYISN